MTLNRIILALSLCAALAPQAQADTLTVLHGPVPQPTYVDLGPQGDSVGDMRIWHFMGAVQGDLAVSIDFIMTTTAHSDDPAQLDNRMTDAVFVFGADTGDSLMVHGLGPYPKKGSTVQTKATLERAIIGGTGKYAGAGGTVLSTHLDDDTWQHLFNIQ